MRNCPYPRNGKEEIVLIIGRRERISGFSVTPGRVQGDEEQVHTYIAKAMNK